MSMLRSCIVRLFVPVLALAAALALPSNGVTASENKFNGGCSRLRELLNSIPFGDPAMDRSETDLPVDTGIPVCIFEDIKTKGPTVWLLDAPDRTAIAEQKAVLTPVLAEAGIDPCRIVYWQTVSARGMVKLDGLDHHDTLMRCEPELIAHGPESARRLEVVRAAMREAMAKGEEVFGWPGRLPLEVHVWDDNTGLRGHGVGDTALHPHGGVVHVHHERLAGIAVTSGTSMSEIVLDLSILTTDEALRKTVAHEYGHILQFVTTGDTENTPYWAIEGGADYFAMKVVGQYNHGIVNRFQEARNDARLDRALHLGKLATQRGSDALGPYVRGYAAFRFLSERWGEQWYVQLYQQNRDGSPEKYLSLLQNATGMDLDTFNRELDAWLRGQPAIAPPPGPDTNLAAGSMLVRYFTAHRPNSEEWAIQSRFTATDKTVNIVMDWDCHDGEPEAVTEIITPSGDVFARYTGRVRPGCGGLHYIALDMDMQRIGRTVRTTPGRWTARVSLNDKPQGSVTFTIE